MDEGKQPGDVDKFQSDLDSKHGKWQSRNNKLLKAALFVAWAPGILFITSILLAVVYPAPDHGPLVVFHLSLVFGSIIINGVLATTVAIWAGAAVQLSPGSFLDVAQPNGYTIFRQFVRLVCMKWIAWLMFAPTCVGILIYFIYKVGVDSSSHSQGQHPGNSDAYAIAMLLFWIPLLGLTYGWCLLELAQFIALRYSNSSVRTRIIVSLLAIGAYFALVSFWPYIGETLFASYGMEWIVSLVGILVYVLPLIFALYMMLATRKPNPAMFEGL